jgi:hypothetical protein
MDETIALFTAHVEFHSRYPKLALNEDIQISLLPDHTIKELNHKASGDQRIVDAHLASKPFGILDKAFQTAIDVPLRGDQGLVQRGKPSASSCQADNITDGKERADAVRDGIMGSVIQNIDQSKLSRRQRHSGRLLRPPLPGWWDVYTWGLYRYSKSRDREMTWINDLDK